MAQSTINIDVGANVTYTAACRALRIVEWFLQDNPGVFIHAEATPAGLSLAFAQRPAPTPPPAGESTEGDNE